MILLLALIVQIVQIHGELKSNCDLDDVYVGRIGENWISGKNYDFGNDYLKWIWVTSLYECQRECESTVDPNATSLSGERDLNVCHGITWIKNGNRNCALYNARGIESGVYRQGQDSYRCAFALPSGADELNSGSGTAGSSGVRRGGIAWRPSRPNVYCKSRNRYGKTVWCTVQSNGKCPRSC